METLVPLIVALPIAGFAFSALFGRRIQATYGKTAASFVPVSLIVITWLIAMGVAFTALTGGFGEHGANVTLWQWIHAGTFSVDIGFHVDNLTAVLLIVVTTIGMLVHIYSIGYMSHDGGYWRFFAYLNLFMFSMLLLVLSDNFLLIFAGWELVASRATCSSGSGTASRARPSPRRRRSSSTGSATSGSRSGSWPSG
ncbi:MAG TPA: hypothetical protein VK656_06025 [Candidatus Acidoferrum sp.]|nr:hypothetical protein [Candidatus Acidoferrum sp.]